MKVKKYVADGGVKVDETVQIVQFLFIVGIHFVEYNLDGNMNRLLPG